MTWFAAGLALFMVVFLGLLARQVLSARAREEGDGREPGQGSASAPGFGGGGQTREGPRAQGWIRTSARGAEGLPSCIEAHAALTTPVHPVSIPAVVSSHPDGFLVVDFPEGVPAFVLCNLVGWIDDGAQSTVGYLTAPSNGVRYGLMPDGDNAAGDTLRGAGSDGARVEVYLPDGAVRPVPWAPHCDEPEREGARELHRFVVTVDGHHGFGNPGFVVEGTPPPVPTQERSRIDAALWALSEDPSCAWGLYAPDPAEMAVPPDELESRYGGQLRFATSDDHDQWLFVLPDGRWLEAHLDDPEPIPYASGAHVAAEWLLRASEDVLADEELRSVARALGLPSEAAEWTREGGAGDYDTWKAQLIARVVAAVA